MRRSLIAVLALALMLVSVFASCTGKTPDVIAKEEAALKSLDNITWKLEVEGAEKTEYTREADYDSDFEGYNQRQLFKIDCTVDRARDSLRDDRNG